MNPKTPTAEDDMEGEVGPQRHRPPVDRSGINHKVNIFDVTTGQTQEGYIIGNVDENGDLIEVFLQGFGKSGSTLDGWTQLSAILLSVALQYGAELPMLARKISHMHFPPYGPTDNPDIPHCRSVPDYIFHWLVLRYGTVELWEDLKRIDKQLEKAWPVS